MSDDEQDPLKDADKSTEKEKKYWKRKRYFQK